MKVERIYSRNVVGIPRSGTLQEAAETMRRFHVGALLVVDQVEGEARVVGIVTDRDMVLHALAENLDARRIPVAKVMSPMVASVSEEADVLDALERMRAAGARRLLVIGPHGAAAGIVSIDDIVDGLAAELARTAGLMKAGRWREIEEAGGGPRAVY